MKDISEEEHKRNWDSKNQQRRKRKKEKLLKMKSKKGKKYKFASGSMTKSSWQKICIDGVIFSGVDQIICFSSYSNDIDQLH